MGSEQRPQVGLFFARVGREIKGLVNARPHGAADPLQQRPGRSPRSGVMPMGSYVEQGPQNKGAPLHFGMGEDELAWAPCRRRPPHAAPAEVKDVDVERARAHARPRLPAGRALELFEEPQQLCRCQRALGERNGVEVMGLASAADGAGCIEAGASDDSDAAVGKLAARSRQGCSRTSPHARHVAAEGKKEGLNPVWLRTCHLLSTSGGILPRSSLCYRGSDALGICTLRHYVTP